MNIDNDSTLYLILHKHPEWKDWGCEVRSTKNGATDFLIAKTNFVLPEVKIAVTTIPGSEILNRAIVLRDGRRLDYRMDMDTILESGRPLIITLSASQKIERLNQ